MTNMDTDKLCPSSGQTTNIGQRQTGCQTETCKGYGSTGCGCRIRELNDKPRTSMSGGLYAIMNAVRLALSSSRGLSTEYEKLILQGLVRAADRKGGFAHLYLEGMEEHRQTCRGPQGSP